MPPIHFKLSKSDDHTRRATFQELPTWPELASKLQLLFGPIDKVAVAYVDNDNDEITASSNEELQDFYQTSYQPGHVIKLTVLDLTIRSDIPLPTTPATINRNTFGQDNFEFVDAGWQGLTGLGIGNFVDTTSEGPHAFVEVLSSDASGFAKDQAEHIMDTDSDDGHSTALPPSATKGKGRMSSFGGASTTSVVAEETSHKYPIHVVDRNSVKRAASSTGPALKASNIEDPDRITAQSTPRVQPVDFDVSDEDTQQTSSAKPTEIEDPPLSSFDVPPACNASASLSNDVAALLNAITNIVSSHPELSEGFRNIVRNASNGTYWQAHRSAISEAVNEMSRTVGETRNSEEEASRRISEAIGGLLRTFTQATSEFNEEQTSGAASQPAAQPQQPFTTFWAPTPHANRRIWARRSSPWSAAWHIPPWGVPPPHGPPPGPHHLHGYHTPLAHRPPPPSHGPPPPPSPLHSSPPPPPPPASTLHGSLHGPTPGPPPPPPPPLHGPGAAPYSGPSPHPGLQQYHQHASHGPHSPVGYPGHGPSPLIPAPHGPELTLETEQIDPNDLSGQLKLAKKRYRHIKEAIRLKEQEERDHKKLNPPPPHASTPKDSTQIVSHDWGTYPPLETYSAPRRHNTHPGHAYRRGERKPEDLNSRAQARIARRLSDMGFTETSFPNLPGKIRAQMPTNGIISKEVEDDVVTTLLEELLAMTSRGPAASGAGPNGNGNSGTWH